MEQDHPVYLYVPGNFTAADFLSRDLKRYADCASYIMHSILAGQTFGKADSAGYVPLKAAYLRNFIPNRIERDLRHHLIDAGVIESDGHWVVGHKAIAYRLAERFHTKALRLTVKDRRLARRIKEHRGERSYFSLTLDVHKYLRAWYERLEIDVGRATQVALTMDRPFLQLSLVEMIASGNQEFSYCKQGRVHTVVTRLSRSLRSCLHFQGSPLVNIDVKNSQPLLLGLVLLQYRSAGNSFLNIHSFDSCGNDPYLHLMAGPSLHFASSSSSRNSPRDPRPSITMSILEKEVERIMGGGMSERERLLKPDEVRYVTLCEAGTLYEHLHERGGLAGISRDEVKVRVFREVLYGQNRAVTGFTRAFGEAFPNVTEVVRAAKRKDYTHLACLMQRLESTIMINRVCRSLMDEHPDVPVVTIHDSIMTTPDHVGLVSRLIRREFNRVGLTPMLSVDGEVKANGVAA